MRGRAACIVSVLAGGALLLPSAAAANHLHALATGAGSCVVLAPQGQERFVTLPAASFNNTTEPATTANPHPLHVHLHRGMPGSGLDIAVLGSPADDCGTYLNYDGP